MFLKSIELNGFKSFAEKTVINFDSPYTGIVGPNGCGKSNITDAIRWVLGEQSPKSLRGTSMSDVVFQGAEGKRPVNMAEVTLYFDNSNHYLNTEYNEVSITRRLYKNTNESEYLINNTPCRLKDVQDLIIDTGLGKDSLSIISQGNIVAFAEAKPIERRALFEEAAGVAKYRKRKEESLSKLSRTQDNIDRMQDIVNELEKQVAPLRRQAAKAQQYEIKKQRLTEIEIAVIVNDIKTTLIDLDTLNKQIESLDYQDAALQANITLLESEVDALKEEVLKLDSSVAKQQDELLDIINEIQVLERRKVEVDEKRKYILSSGTDEAKIEQTRQLLEEARIEYEDREARKNNSEALIELLGKNVDDYNAEIIKQQEAVDSLTRRVNYLNNRKSILEDQQKAPLQSQDGVKKIMESKNALPGIYDIVSNLFIPDDGYQQAISVALGGALYHIVCENEDSARTAIRFLKNNRSGRATFLPLSVMRGREVSKENLFIAENTDGFLGLASDFVDCEEKFDPVLLNLLGTTMVTDTLENANELSKRLHHSYNIVTLDGDVVHRGGSMSGGYNKRMESPMTTNYLLDEVTKELADVTLEYNSENAKLNKLLKEKSEAEEKIVNEKIQLASLQQILAIKRNKYDDLKQEYDRINISEEEGSVSFEDELIKSLNDAYAKRDAITTDISGKRTKRINVSAEQQRKEIQLRQKRQEVTLLQMNFNNAKIEQTRLETIKDQTVERLSREYHMTYEFASSKDYGDIDIVEAKQEVLVLREEIASLGNINMDAPKDYEEVNERYEFMVSQLDDLQAAKNQLLDAINEMDSVMSVQFKEMFDKINGELNKVFTVLFGGGRAKLILEDPNDILNTGIDIDVQPPGKNIANIRLFSGGEKSLIAICVLFAILKSREMPLCIFDEVEASLSQGNVDRFAKYIHEFEDTTQFIVITHRPGTMTECDVLYGITMEQKGISKVLKVKLNDALDFAEVENNNGTVQ